MDKEKMIPSGFSFWDELIGGLPLKSLVGIYGEAGVGKSVLAIHFPFSSGLIKKANALFVYTEDSPDLQLDSWVKILNGRYKTEAVLETIEFDPIKKAIKQPTPSTAQSGSAKPTKGVIYAAYIYDIRDILAFHGFPANLQTHDSGKIMINMGFKTGDIIPRAWETPIGRFVHENNIKYLVYDSVTAPNEIFVGGEPNFPVRDEAEGLWLSTAKQLSAFFDMSIVCITQATRTPRMGMKDKGRPVGGKAIGHHLKYVALIEAFKNPMTGGAVTGQKANLRKVWCFRHLWKPTMGAAGYKVFEFKGDGIHDVKAVITDDEEEE